jgi:hypothetical protein
MSTFLVGGLAGYGSGLQPSGLLGAGTWACGPGWYVGAPLALVSVTVGADYIRPKQSFHPNQQAGRGPRLGWGTLKRAYPRG